MKRVLIIYNSFDEWSMGPIRLRRIARHLPAAGYKPIVLTSPTSSRSAADIPEGLECHRIGGVDLAELYKKLRASFKRKQKQSGQETTALSANRDNRLSSFINRWFMVPEKQITWKKPAIQMAREYLRNNPVDVLFGSLAPRTNLLVTAQLAKEFNLPSVIEFRDLWTGSPYHILMQPTALHRMIHSRLEKKTIKNATCISAVCQGIAGYLDNAYKRQLKRPTALNYNFFDPAEYPRVDTPNGARPMVVSYIGALYANRSPLTFFKGFKQFVTKHGLSPRDVQFRWAGAVVGVAGVDDVIREQELEPYIMRLGQVNHEDALKELCQSDVSVLIQAPGDTIHIPGKLFEAMGANVPLLAIADVEEVHSIIKDTNAGVSSPRTPEGIADSLSRFWELHQKGEAWHFNEEAKNKFRADHVVGKLAELFNEAIALHDQQH